MVASEIDRVKKVVGSMKVSQRWRDDVIQEVLLRCLLKKESALELPFIVLKHYAIDALRKLKGHSMEVLPEEVVEEQEEDWRELLDSVMEGVEGLRMEEQRVLFLHYYQGMSVREIAIFMGKSHGEVLEIRRSAIRCIREQLKKSLEMLI